MKNQLFVLSLALGLAGCIGGGSAEPSATAAPSAAPAQDVAAAAPTDAAACPYKAGDMSETECREMAKDCPMPKGSDTASAGGSATGAASGGEAPMACCAKEGN